MKRISKKPVLDANFKRHIFVLYIAALVLLLGLSGVVGLLIRPLQQDNSASTLVVRTYIKEAVDGLSRQTTIDPKEKKEYIYEASVRFPAAPGKSFRYGYEAANSKDASKETIKLASNEIYNMAAQGLNASDHAELFNNVPRFQACSREFIIQFQPGIDNFDTEYTLVKTVTLADGRTAYIYRNIACANFFNDDMGNVSDDQKILEKLESY